MLCRACSSDTGDAERGQSRKPKSTTTSVSSSALRCACSRCFQDQGEQFAVSEGAEARDVESGGYAWVYCAFIEPETPEPSVLSQWFVTFIVGIFAA